MVEDNRARPKASRKVFCAKCFLFSVSVFLFLWVILFERPDTGKDAGEPSVADEILDTDHAKYHRVLRAYERYRLTAQEPPAPNPYVELYKSTQEQQQGFVSSRDRN